MGTRRQFSREFKLEAFKLENERGVSVRSLGHEVIVSQVHQSFLRSDRTYGADACGMTCSNWVYDADCIASNGSCVNTLCVRGHGGGASPQD